MSEVVNLDVAENLILTYLSENEEEKSTSELQDELGLNRVLITRVLRNAKNRKPAMVTLDSGKYKFIGNKEAIGSIPEDVKLKFGVATNETNESSPASDDFMLGPIDKQILELLSTRKKFPQSGLMKQFNLDEDESEQILANLEENGLVSSEYLEAFDENSFSLTDEGKNLVEDEFQSASFYEPQSASEEVSEEPIKEADKDNEPKEIEAQTESNSTLTEGGDMTVSGRTFEIPSFDDIPEENSSGRGRPTGDRDFEKLHVYILAYIKEKQPVAKSNISRTLAKILSNFGRNTIVDEVDSLVDIGYVDEQTIGKRELYTLSEIGEETIDRISAGEAVTPIMGHQKPPVVGAKTEGSKPQKTTIKPPQSKVEMEARKPVDSAVKQTVTAEKSPGVSSSPAELQDHDLERIKNRIDQLISDVPGEKGFELRQYFYEISLHVKALEKSKSELQNLCQHLISKV